MTPNAPTAFVALMSQPVVSQDLSVKVMRLKGGVMNMGLWSLEKEKAVMIHQVISAIEAIESNHVVSFWVVSQLELG